MSIWLWKSYSISAHVLRNPTHWPFQSLKRSHGTVDLTWHSDVTLGTSDWLPWSAQVHQRCHLRWVFPYFLVPRWQRPRTRLPSFSWSTHLPRAFPFPSYDCVLQQQCGTYSPASFRGDQPVGVRPINRVVVWLIWGIGVSLYGGVSSSLCAALTSGAVLRGDGDVDHLGAKDMRKKNLRETTEGAERGAGGQRGGRRVGFWTLGGWCKASIGHCGKQSTIKMNNAD